ncbi:3-hydroxyacyl-CoA dehydrogenase [Candidimonas nitroreducens]|uniref:3-hydroxyacyl-CoA dehydrogenase n=1 Tax=Candidimonas nitroreducens TaxID=683354 RepID=A0A225MFZ7_9BURK|nr:3-hydroxyacyl-CoA dehydrogenase [Candidimonas nitroreducens]OWT60174.1 3-hydroxyacyl-CoA dehydrogenase [Candidimonas nitroreducens]
MNIAIIGTGLIGQAWAIVFARGGCNVRLWDGDAAALERASGLIARQIAQLQAEHLLDDAPAATARITRCSELAQALQGADYVQENLPEVLDVKKDIFRKLDELAAPQTVLASSTSSIPASAFTEDLPGRGRCLVAHPVNPPYLVPVVELCGAPWTDAASMEKARSVMQQIGQKPVTVHKELEGFVLNRLQGALLREAFRLVQNGYVSAEDLDATVKDGLGLRWSFMGPFETIDLNAPQGLTEYCARYGGMFRSISEEQIDTEAWSPELIAELERQRRELLPSTELLQRRLWRDQRLMALLRHKRESADEA